MDFKTLLLPMLLGGDADAVKNLLPALASSVTAEKISDEQFQKLQEFAKRVSMCSKSDFVSMIRETLGAVKEAKVV